MNAEFVKKQQRLDQYLMERQLDGVLFSLKANEAWLTLGGSCWVGKESPLGSVDLLYLNRKLFMFAAENEKARTFDEEMAGLDVTVIAHPWYDSKRNNFRELTSGKKIVSDTGFDGTEDKNAELIRLRYAMLPEEITRARKLGEDCANAMKQTCLEIAPGDTEHEISARITEKLMRLGIQAPCCLVAADERIALYRHPIPTFKKVKKQCLVVICGVRHGLVMSMSRMVSFGKISDDLTKRHIANARIEGRFIENTRIGVNAGDVFRAGIAAYAEFGYPDDWKCHHQGGSIGYDSRDYVCTFATDEVIVDNQMFAFNPTVTGTKIEDTFLLNGDPRDFFTAIPGWPTVEVASAVGTLQRPGILIR